MSNTAVGTLYKRIIDTVIESSRTDFEENGIDHKTLEQLRESWQAKLSLGNRANFPWDPQPESAPQQSTNNQSTSQATAPRNVPTPTTTAPSASPAAPPPLNQNQTSSASIKQETGYDHNNQPHFLNLPQTGNYQSNAYAAQQRAAQLIHQQFGSQGQNSIGAMHAGMAHQNQMRQQQAHQAQQQPQQPALQHPQQPLPPAPPQQQPQPQPQQQVGPAPIKQEAKPSIGQAQTDGAGDDDGLRWDAIISKRRVIGDDEPMGRIAADHFIRNHVEAMNQRLEAGGLLIPLDERYPMQKFKGKRRVQPQVSAAISSRLSTARMAVFDGPADDSDDGRYPDEEDDNDAINSDLDDPEDDLAEGIEGGHEGDVILCLYDKVQRVKNKWKCTLKDGVVTIDGKDYVFHKAQGEFEW